MSRFDQQLSAAARAHDNAAPDEDNETEWVGERTEELTAERLADDKTVQDAIQDALGNDYDDVFASMLRRFYMAFDASPDEPLSLSSIAVDLFKELRPYVAGAIREEARSDAQREYDKAMDEAAEARDEAREASRWAA